MENPITYSSVINFYLNGVLHSLDLQHGAATPATTVLDYLRGNLHKSGTKEGCGLGDCGACTICLYDGKYFTAVNACLMLLPMIDGKHIITIEHLSEGNHPVQRALARRRGSQCGFCSPGMVMSAYVHYRNGLPFTKEAIEIALSGNLCRCTGYQSILKAMMDVALEPPCNEPLPQLPPPVGDFLKIETRDISYMRPRNLEELTSLCEKWPKAKIIAGATDVAVLLKHNPLEHHIWIDAGIVEQLKIKEISSDAFHLGASVTIEELRNILADIYPSAADYLSHFASLQVRNRASIAGSLCGASPVGDILPLMMALGARFILKSTKTSRSVDADSWVISYRKTCMREDEILYAIEIPKPAEGQYLYCFKQSKRGSMDISTISCCLSFIIRDNCVINLRSAFGGMADRVLPSVSVEKAIEGRPFSLPVVKQAASLIARDFHPIDDVRGSSAGRLRAAEGIIIKSYLNYNGTKK